MRPYFIGEDDFRVYLPDVSFVEKSGDEEAHDSRKMRGIMNTSSLDRQDEHVLAKGLDLGDFLSHGHFNDNHDQATSAIVGYPQKAFYKSNIELPNGRKVDGWICEGYMLKGTKRADEIWELAKALSATPDRRLGFSIEGKVQRRKNNVVEKATVRNVAVTNAPVNTDATWDVLAKSFCDADFAVKAMMAGYGTSPANKTGGTAMGTEDLDSQVRRLLGEAVKKRKVKKSIPDVDDLIKAIGYVLEFRPDFSEEAAVELVHYLVTKELS